MFAKDITLVLRKIIKENKRTSLLNCKWDILIELDLLNNFASRNALILLREAPKHYSRCSYWNLGLK
jgi:hypothetical protein